MEVHLTKAETEQMVCQNVSCGKMWFLAPEETGHILNSRC